MTARQTRYVAILCAVLAFAATATALNAWQEFTDQLAALAGWLPVIGEGLR